MLIRDALKGATTQLERLSSSALLDAELLLLHAFKKNNRTWLISHMQDAIPKEIMNLFSSYIEKRKIGIPVAYITKTKAFYGEDFYVDERVLVPRPETEQLVEETLKHLTVHSLPLTYIDIGTGSGIIPITILKKLKASSPLLNIRCLATDISQDALDVAKKNAETFGVADNITFLQGNLLEPFINHFCRPSDPLLVINNSAIVITANLPYVPEYEYRTNKHNLQHEPYQALVAEDDGMALIKELLKQLFKNNIQALLILEHGHQHKDPIVSTVAEYFPSAHTKTLPDIAGKARITLVYI